MSQEFYLLLQKADQIAQSKDWSALNQLLANIQAQDDSPDPSKTRSQLFDVAIASHCLNLALECLRFGDFQARWDLSKIFSSFGKAAIAPLLDLLQDPNIAWEGKWFAIRILGELRDPAVPVALVNLLKELELEEFAEDQADEDEADGEDHDLFATIIDALVQQGASAISELKGLLKENTTRLMAVRALAQIRTSATIAPLLTIVDDPNSAIRAIAIEALISFHDPVIPPVLIRALNDRNRAVRKSAVEGLGLRPELANTLNLVEKLTPCLWDIHLEVCQQAAIALGRLKQAAAIPSLMKCICATEGSLSFQLAMIRAIAWIPASEALEALRTLLLDDLIAPTFSTKIHAELATVLGQVSAHLDQAAAIAGAALSAPALWLTDTTVRQALIVSLGQLGQWESVEAIVSCLADPELSVRLHAIAALKHFNGDRLHSYLLTQHDQPEINPKLKQGIIEALAAGQA